MVETSDALWLAFEALAKTYPHDHGVRLTADLARWLLEERQRQRLPAPPILQKVVRTVTRDCGPQLRRRSGGFQLTNRGAPRPFNSFGMA
jgi:hypothetical protein